MAKIEFMLNGEFNQVLATIDNSIKESSISSSYEDGSDCTFGDARCAVRVYERYSMLGNNRVSLNITLLEKGNNLFLSAITSGGSQAMFFKINTFGEDAFLDILNRAIEKYIK